MKEQFSFGESDRLREREPELVEFLERMFDEEDRPYFVADEACLYDIHAGDDAGAEKVTVTKFGGGGGK